MCCRSFCSFRLIRFQTRPVCFNPGQFGAGTKHKSQVTGRCSTKLYRNNPNIGPKNFYLGIRLALMNVEDTFCIGKTMTCDLCFAPAPN